MELNKLKTIYLFFVALCICSTTSGQHSHWSLAAKGGLDYYFVEPQGQSIINNAGWCFPSIDLEYNFNPILSLSANYSYLTYNRMNAHGNTSDITLIGSWNYFNSFIPKRSGFFENTSGYLNFGGGIGNYFYDIVIDNNTSSAIEIHSSKSDFSPLIALGLSFEHNISRSLSIMLEGEVRYYLQNDIGGLATEELWKNSALVALVGLRYKFNATKKKHMRNINYLYNCHCSLESLP